MKKTAIVICALVSLWTGGPVFASAGLDPASEQRPALQNPISAPETAVTTRKGGEASSYAAREKAAPQAADFKGGDSAIYIGGSTLAIVLLIVLLVILL